MVTAWTIYALMVGVLVGGGALIMEALLRAHRLATRWVWAGALLLSVVWPLGHILLGLRPATAGAPPPDPTRVVALDPLAVRVGPRSVLHLLDGPIVLGWILVSGLLLALALLLLLRTHRLRKGWTGEEAGGRAVLLSDDWGPAVVGFLRPQIVLPAWCRELGDDELALILDHEAEHLRAGDLRLLLSAALLPILAPWNVPLWWQLSRLRVAVEGDCDLRVLRKHPGRTRSYLELLLEVGRRPPHGQFAGAMLSEPEETLERRIRIMTMPFPRKPWTRALLLGSGGVLLVAVACWAPGPMGPEEAPAPEKLTAAELPPEIQIPAPPGKTGVEGDEISIPPTPAELEMGETSWTAAELDEVSAAPVFTPYTVRPDLANREELTRILAAEYPPLLKGAGIGGTVVVWCFVDERGEVGKVLVRESSGHQALDEAALRVGKGMEFTPALNRDKAVPVWIILPITFTPQ